ncbi:hypothetical protein NXH76_09280 [Blautia schinkii]|nr:hypothetical protein [Blautia schinkii]
MLKQEVFCLVQGQDTKENQIVSFIEKKVEGISFSALLKETYHGEEPLQSRLIDKLTEYEAASGDSKETISRKVRNWLKGCNQPGNREELFKICFALGLDEKNSEKILFSTAESGIHYRNPKELIYAFCLRKGYDYPKAQELLLESGYQQSPTSSLETQQAVRKLSNSEPEQYTTVSIKDEFKTIQDLDVLKEFLQQYEYQFGLHHNTAYRKFVLMVDYLLDGNVNTDYAGAPREKKLSIEQATEDYLRMGIPYQKKSGSHTKLQKLIKKNWPSPKFMQEMYSRKRDVNRKTLLLLYLATEGMGVEVSENSFAAEHYQRMNLMLSACGMTLLNPHNPFDYLIIQSLHLKNEDDFMSWKMERLLCRLFGKNGKTAYIEEKRK